MKDNTLELRFDNGKYFDILLFEEFLRRIPDPRKSRGKIYELSKILTMILVAKLVGMDKPSEITEWIQLRRPYFVQLFQLDHERVPCLNTVRNVMGNLVAEEELEKACAQYIHREYGEGETEHWSMDGKAMRGTIPKGQKRGVHLLSVYDGATCHVVAQVDVREKTNEIGAVKGLIAKIDLKNKVLSADAMHTQRDFSVQVKANGGDYLLQAKENQSKLLEDIHQYFEKPKQSKGWHKPGLPQAIVEETTVGHGRIERRRLQVVSQSIEYLDWPHANQVYRLERHVKDTKSGKERVEVSFGLTSCSPDRASANQLFQWIREHWLIENGLHYRRDVTLKEDATRMKIPQMARVMAQFNNFVITISNRLGFDNLASARRQFDASIAHQLAQLPDF